jgi:hypothetical protein
MTLKFDAFGVIRVRLKEKPVEASWNNKAVRSKMPLE